MSESHRNKKLRSGFTTGSCATAAAKAAATVLLSGEKTSAVQFTTKNGTAVTMEIAKTEICGDSVSCSVIKDAGDDPDVTHGIEIIATVSKQAQGIEIDGGVGVGRVTRNGLKIAVGCAAINPVPLQMIEQEARTVMQAYDESGGLKIVISVPQGIEIAKKTMNERLGIIGGISILGTSGIVEPMSERALIDTIKEEMNVHVAEGKTELLVTPGNYGRDFAKDVLNLDIESAIKCSNYIGEMLDYAEVLGVKNITLIGHAGKLFKLAGGIMNTYSRVADCRMEILAAHCALFGAKPEVIQQIMDCITVDAAIKIIQESNLQDEVFKSIGKKIDFHLRERTRASVCVRCIVFTQEYGVLIDSKKSKKEIGL